MDKQIIEVFKDVGIELKQCPFFALGKRGYVYTNNYDAYYSTLIDYIKLHYGRFIGTKHYPLITAYILGQK